jgi:outer membrane protein assembly factor BamB
LRWSVELGGDVDSSPVLGPDGTIYVGADDRKLYALR